MNFLGAGWIWMYIGAGLMLAEILVPGFVMFFFGLSAATVGLLMLVVPADAFRLTLTWQFALFSFFSVAYLLTLRRYAKSVFLGDSDRRKTVVDEFAGRVGEVVAPIAQGVPGRVMLGDAEWDAVSAAPISAGAKVRVLSRSNLTLTVEAV